MSEKTSPLGRTKKFRVQLRAKDLYENYVDICRSRRGRERKAKESRRFVGIASPRPRKENERGKTSVFTVKKLNGVAAITRSRSGIDRGKGVYSAARENKINIYMINGSRAQRDGVSLIIIGKRGSSKARSNLRMIASPLSLSPCFTRTPPGKYRERQIR